MAIPTVATVKVHIETANATEEIIAFRDRLMHAGFTLAQASAITARAFTHDDTR